MGGFLIWVAIIVYIVIRCMKNAKNDQRTATPNVPRDARARQQMPQQRMPQQRMPQQTRQAPRPSQSAKRPPQTRVPKQQDTILQRAKANAARQFEDDTKPSDQKVELGRVPVGDEIMKDKAMARHIHSEHEDGHEAELHNQPGVDDFDTYHLMDEVNDLIVKGYSGNLEFERDFLAEATDMLNRMYN